LAPDALVTRRGIASFTTTHAAGITVASLTLPVVVMRLFLSERQIHSWLALI
jgi:hypothetical protein